MDERRTLRVSETVREELVRDDRFRNSRIRAWLAVKVSEGHVSSDGQATPRKVAVAGRRSEQKASIAALEHARHYLRRELATG